MNFARVIRMDESDLNVFHAAAEPGEWAIPGTFAFSNWSEDDLTGKARQEFAHGWLGLESFGRASVVAVTSITEAERAALVDILAFHFTEAWGAPHIDAARPVAEEEIAHMAQMCSATIIAGGRAPVPRQPAQAASAARRTTAKASSEARSRPASSSSGKPGSNIAA